MNRFAAGYGKNGPLGSAPEMASLFSMTWSYWLLRLIGVGFIALAVTLYSSAPPGSDGVFHAMSAIGFAGLGLFAAVATTRTQQPEFCFDCKRQELRVSETPLQGGPRVVLRRSFCSLGGVRIASKDLQVLDQDGSILMKLPMPDPDMRAQLREALAGHLPMLA